MNLKCDHNAQNRPVDLMCRICFAALMLSPSLLMAQEEAAPAIDSERVQRAEELSSKEREQADEVLEVAETRYNDLLQKSLEKYIRTLEMELSRALRTASEESLAQANEIEKELARVERELATAVQDYSAMEEAIAVLQQEVNELHQAERDAWNEKDEDEATRIQAERRNAQRKLARAKAELKLAQANNRELQPGLKVVCYDYVGDRVPRRFDDLEQKWEDVVSSIGIPERVESNADNFALRFTGFIKIPEACEVDLAVNSDDGSKVLINNGSAVEHDGVHGPSWRSRRRSFEAKLYTFEVVYFDQKLGQELEVAWRPAGASDEAWEPIPSEYFWH